MDVGISGNADSVRAKRFYHGTRAPLRPGDFIEPGNSQKAGEAGRATTYVYLTPNLDEAIWEAEIAGGEGSGRVYLVEPIGQVEDAAELTSGKSPAHPSMSCGSREPLRVTAEITDWQGHSPEAVKAMRDGLEWLEQLGVEPIDD